MDDDEGAAAVVDVEDLHVGGAQESTGRGVVAREPECWRAAGELLLAFQPEGVCQAESLQERGDLRLEQFILVLHSNLWCSKCLAACSWLI